MSRVGKAAKQLEKFPSHDQLEMAGELGAQAHVAAQGMSQCMKQALIAAGFGSDQLDALNVQALEGEFEDRLFLFALEVAKSSRLVQKRVASRKAAPAAQLRSAASRKAKAVSWGARRLEESPDASKNHLAKTFCDLHEGYTFSTVRRYFADL